MCVCVCVYGGKVASSIRGGGPEKEERGNCDIFVRCFYVKAKGYLCSGMEDSNYICYYHYYLLPCNHHDNY